MLKLECELLKLENEKLKLENETLQRENLAWREIVHLRWPEPSEHFSNFGEKLEQAFM